MTSYAEGTPCWVDLATSDPEGARAFYGGLFGWDFEIGGPDTGHYTMCTLNGLNVAGMGGDPAPEGMPTAWTTYLASDDVAASARRITDSGGQLLMEPLEVMSFGRMVIASDPAGAAFGMWEAVDHIGASLVSEPGTIVWNELETHDLPAAQAFYTAVVGWDWQEEDSGEGGAAYRMFLVGDRVVGGAQQLGDEQPQDVPSHWLPYFAVGDTDAAVASVERLGGKVLAPAVDSQYGRWAVVSDPQGATFAVIV